MGIHRKKQSLFGQVVASAFISILMGLLFLWTGAKTVHIPIEKYIWNAGYSLCIGLSLFANGIFFNLIEKKYILWVQEPVKSLIIAIVFHIIYSSAVIFLFNWIWFVLARHQSWHNFLIYGWFIILGEYIIFLIIASIIYAKSFFREWRDEVIQSERLKKEAIALQYQVMQNQVNPHFLFNSLNVLCNLIDINAEKAKNYTLELSDFYRELLLLKDQDIVPLSQEIQFVKRYVYLQKIRFGDNFNVSFYLTEQFQDNLIPLSLQMLIENAVKHNEISREHPLEIIIGTKFNDYLFVENNLNLKKDVVPGNKIGLVNLEERYFYLTGKKVIVEKTDHFFRVSLPLITIEA